MLTQSSAAIAPASRITALPDWVRRKSRSGASRLRAHAVRPASGAVVASTSCSEASIGISVTGDAD